MLMKINRKKILANIKKRMTEEKKEQIKKEEEYAKYKSKYYAKHREEILAKMKEKRNNKGLKKLTDPEKIKERDYNHEYYLLHREEILLKRHKHYQDNKDDYKFNVRMHREEEKESDDK